MVSVKKELAVVSKYNEFPKKLIQVDINIEFLRNQFVFGEVILSLVYHMTICIKGHFRSNNISSFPGTFKIIPLLISDVQCNVIKIHLLKPNLKL